jgi:ADP-ribosylation factor-binding protein GGA
LVINVPPRIKNPIFEDNEKSKKLEKLLQSKNPTDLEEANRIIKQMVKQVIILLNLLLLFKLTK